MIICGTVTLELSSKAFIMSPLQRILSTHWDQRGPGQSRGPQPASAERQGHVCPGHSAQDVGWKSSPDSVTFGGFNLTSLRLRFSTCKVGVQWLPPCWALCKPGVSDPSHTVADL